MQFVKSLRGLEEETDCSGMFVPEISPRRDIGGGTQRRVGTAVNQEDGVGKKEQMGICSGEEDPERRLDEQAARRARALSEAVRAELAERVAAGDARRVARDKFQELSQLRAALTSSSAEASSTHGDSSVRLRINAEATKKEEGGEPGVAAPRKTKQQVVDVDSYSLVH